MLIISVWDTYITTRENGKLKDIFHIYWRANSYLNQGQLGIETKRHTKGCHIDKIEGNSSSIIFKMMLIYRMLAVKRENKKQLQHLRILHWMCKAILNKTNGYAE